MYTIILYVGNTNNMDRYNFWLQDFENAGFGRVIYPLSLKKEVVNGIIRLVRGRDSWSIIVVIPGKDQSELKGFVGNIKATVEGEKDNLVHMPEKIWLVLKKYSYQDTIKPGDGIDLLRLPANCRLLEYIVDIQNRERYLEDIELLCIVILFAVNQIPSENFIVYQRHKVSVEINVKEMRQYIQEYSEILHQGTNQARHASEQIAQKIVDHNMEVVQDSPNAISGVESTIQYVHKWRKERQEREKAYFSMKASVREEKILLAGEVMRRGNYLHINDIELSKEDESLVLEKKQRDEIDMVKLIVDLRHTEQQLEAKRIAAERKRSSALLLCWEGSESLKLMGESLLAIFGVCMLTLVEAGVSAKIDKGMIISVFVIAIVFMIIICIYFIAYNMIKRISSRRALMKVSKKIKEAEITSKENIYKFALLCCRIRKKQSILRAHSLAIKNKKEKIERARQHYAFCKSRLEKLNEWNWLSCSYDATVDESMNKEEIRVLDMCEKPEKEMAYNMINTLNNREIPVNESGKVINSPFLFVRKLIIERVFQ